MLTEQRDIQYLQPIRKLFNVSGFLVKMPKVGTKFLPNFDINFFKDLETFIPMYWILTVWTTRFIDVQGG